VRDRVVTSLVLGFGLLAVLFIAPAGIGLAAFAIMVLVGAWEWAALAGARSTGMRLLYVVMVAGLMAACFWTGRGEIVAWLPWLALAAWLVCFVFILRYPVELPRLLSGIVGLVVLPAGWWFLSRILADPDLGPAWVLTLFLLVACADIGAFFAGRQFGRRPLAPAVSPKKTWEGVAGGLLAAALGGLAASLVFQRPPLAMMGIGLTVAAISVVGDLTISMFKRTAGLKDSGTLLPGHGGVLDRTDSLLAAVPLFFVAVGAMSGA
jgi:phosphatidate cytidylyltransferase